MLHSCYVNVNRKPLLFESRMRAKRSADCADFKDYSNPLNIPRRDGTSVLRAARWELQVRGFPSASMLTIILPRIASLCPLEVLMVKTGQRALQAFPPLRHGIGGQYPHAWSLNWPSRSRRSIRTKAAEIENNNRLNFIELFQCTC